MSSGFNEPAVLEEEPRDRTKWIWLGVIVLVVLLVAVLGLRRRGAPPVSEVLVKHILISFNAADPADRDRARELAKEIRQRLLDGERFSKLAKEHSNDPFSSKRGGNLGWSQRGSFADKFEEYVWSGPIGEISPVVQTSFGYHVILIVERRLSEVDLYKQQQQS